MPAGFTQWPLPTFLAFALLAKSAARLDDGKPASPVGELINAIVKEVEAANQSNSQGATDSGVQAEEGQAKERAWELFTG